MYITPRDGILDQVYTIAIVYIYMLVFLHVQILYVELQDC